MMKIYYKQITCERKWNFLLAFLVPVLMLCSCNKNVERVLNDSYGPSGTDYKSGKVLLLVLDGVGGKTVQKAVNTGKAPQIKSLLNNSMYTYEGLADSKVALDEVNSQRGWANIMTGTTNNGVGKEFDDISQIKNSSFLTLLKTRKPALKTCLLASNSAYVTTFGKNVDQAEKLADDEAIKAKTVDILAKAIEEVPDVTVVQLNGVEEVGKSSGYFDSEFSPLPEIVDAVGELDSKIGEIMSTLKGRTSFEKENWLVIITSSFGGKYGESRSTGSTYYSDLERNTFTLYFNPKFQSSLQQQPASDEIKYSYFSPYFSGSGEASKSANVIDPVLFDMGKRNVDSKSYTIQFMVWDNYSEKTGKAASGSQEILSKRDAPGSGGGWNIRFASSGGNSRISVMGNGINTVSSSYGVVRKVGNPWRVVSVVFEDKGTTRYGDTLSFYMDGVLVGKSRFDGNSELSSKNALSIGLMEGGNSGSATRFFVTNLQFYNIALPASYIAANHCKTRIDEIESFPYWDNLIGYWPNDREEDFGTGRIKDYSQYGAVRGGINAGKSDMQILNPFWESGSKVDENICPTPDASFYRAVFNAVDIPYQIFQWFGANIDKSWSWDGIGWAMKYKELGE